MYYSVVEAEVFCLANALQEDCKADVAPVLVDSLGAAHRIISDKYYGTDCHGKHQGT